MEKAPTEKGRERLLILVLLTEYLFSATPLVASDHRKYDCCSQAT